MFGKITVISGDSAARCVEGEMAGQEAKLIKLRRFFRDAGMFAKTAEGKGLEPGGISKFSWPAIRSPEFLAARLAGMCRADLMRVTSKNIISHLRTQTNADRMQDLIDHLCLPVEILACVKWAAKPPKGQMIDLLRGYFSATVAADTR